MAGVLAFVPVIMLLAFVGGFAWIGYQMYLYTNQLSDRAQSQLARHNISLAPGGGGLRVGVREVSSEQQADATQNYLVRAWNESRWPDYKSRFWNQDAQKKAAATPLATPSPAATPASAAGGKSSARPTPGSRTASSRQSYGFTS